jgi:hypothetical protein
MFPAIDINGLLRPFSPSGSGGGPELEWLLHVTIWLGTKVRTQDHEGCVQCGMAELLARVEHSFTRCADGIGGCGQIFVKLQEARQQADYDNAKIWKSTDVQAMLADAQRAFVNWGSIRTHPTANEYLLSLLIGNKRE